MLRVEWADFLKIVSVMHAVGSLKDKTLRSIAHAAKDSSHREAPMTLEFCLVALGCDEAPSGDRFATVVDETGIFVIWDDEAVEQLKRKT